MKKKTGFFEYVLYGFLGGVVAIVIGIPSNMTWLITAVIVGYCSFKDSKGGT